jgi:hypothetical protein
MFGSAAGFVGSDMGSALGNFMTENSGSRSVVLLDEFDHCEPETWEGFYHAFDEGEYTVKKVGGGASGRIRTTFSPGGGDSVSGYPLNYLQIIDVQFEVTLKCALQEQ